jgi:hypothetical protein
MEARTESPHQQSTLELGTSEPTILLLCLQPAVDNMATGAAEKIESDHPAVRCPL